VAVASTIVFNFITVENILSHFSHGFEHKDPWKEHEGKNIIISFFIFVPCCA
jgi:hypothetical protein